ncbi:MAG: translation initiation factor IF-3 [Flavobacteriales bacterium]
MATENTGFKRNFNPKAKKEDAHRINGNIRAAQVRLVGEGIEPKIYSLSEALKIAQQMELDLVEIAPNAEPPVCRIIDYGKFLYEQKKKQKQMKQNAAKTVIKEIRFGPNTDDHDFNFKLNHAKKFLQEGAKIKAFVFFKGRTILFKEKGEILLMKFVQELDDFGKAESMPVMEGKRMIVFIAPKKK